MIVLGNITHNSWWDIFD